MRLDLTTLRIFLSVIDEHSMSKAAEREHISAPAVSKRITELEQELGVTLFQRRSNGILATPAGVALATEARQVFHKLEQMCSRISDYAIGDRGKVKVLCSPAGLVGALPEHLKSFRLGHPLVDLQLHEQRSPEVLRSVADGEADVGIFAYEEAALAVSEGLNVIPYQTVRLMLVTPRHHPLSTRRTASFAEAAEYEFVGYSDESFIGALVRRVAREQGLQYRSALVVAGFEALRRMVQADLGVGVVPEPCAVPYAEAMHLGCVTLTDDWAQYRIGICTRARETLPMSTRVMLTHLTGR